MRKWMALPIILSVLSFTGCEQENRRTDENRQHSSMQEMPRDSMNQRQMDNE